jgi:hypothetical protein
MSVVLAERYCPNCAVTKKVVSEVVVSNGELKTLSFECGHSDTVAVIQGLSHFSTSELKARLRYNKGLAKMRNISKATRESVASFIPLLEAELADRRA